MNREVQFLLYNMPADSGKVQVVIKDETIWCTLITEYVTSNTFIRDGLRHIQKRLLYFAPGNDKFGDSEGSPKKLNKGI